MPIKLQCPGCGKVFQLGDDRAGRQARCRCGAVIRVPAAATEPTDSSWEDEVSRAFGPGKPPRSPRGPAQPEAAAGAAPTSGPKASVDDTDASGAGTRPQRPSKPAPKTARETARSLVASLPPIQKWRPKKGDPWPGVVAIACVVYGVLAVVGNVAGIAAGVSGDFFTAVCQTGIAVGVVCGGVLIAKGDPRGPAWAGLACLLFCAFPGLELLQGVRAFVAGGAGLDFLQLLAFSVAAYAVPVAVAVWGLRREIERERREKEEAEDYY